MIMFIVIVIYHRIQYHTKTKLQLSLIIEKHKILY